LINLSDGRYKIILRINSSYPYETIPGRGTFFQFAGIEILQ
jgi:hypothetical protein